jgi:hypothetical protein
MARPVKVTVDYFPHTTAHGDTVFILKSKWGNDGYAVWFQLLEKLGASDGHYIDCRRQVSLIRLAAYCGVTEEVLVEILNMLADLEAIDADLWQQKVIFCQQFIDGVMDAYSRRINKLPTREKVIADANIVIVDINGINDGKSTEREREREREREKEPEAAGRQAAETPDSPPVMSAQEKQIRQAIAEKRELIASKFAHVDIELEIHEMVAKCRGQTINLGADPWVFISRWLKNIKSAGEKGGGAGGGGSRGAGTVGKKAGGAGHQARPGPVSGRSFSEGFAGGRGNSWGADADEEVPVASG